MVNPNPPQVETISESEPFSGECDGLPLHAQAMPNPISKPYTINLSLPKWQGARHIILWSRKYEKQMHLKYLYREPNKCS